MANTKLYFYGTDFTPINPSEGNYNFGFNMPDYPKRKTFRELSADKRKQFLLLCEFLKRAQSEVDNIVLDTTLQKEERRLYDYCNQKICFGGLVGVISLKDFQLPDSSEIVDISLQINTRFDAGIQSDQSIEYDPNINFKSISPFFLMTLLFHDYRPTNNMVSLDEEAFTDILLLYSFIEKYREAYVKGYFKTYHRFEKNDDRVKGSIDISRHLRLNMGMNNGRVAYSYKEKSEYNYINHLIIAAYEHLKTKYFDLSKDAFSRNIRLRDSLEALKYMIGSRTYKDTVLIAKNINSLTHPYYTEYEELRKICIKILRNGKQSLFDGTNNQKVNGILMYVPRLWEKYIENRLRRTGVMSQEQIHVFNVNGGEKYYQLTIPDFVFYSNDSPFMILDAKFKRGWLSAAKTGYLGDLLPDYDKCLRDMVSINGNSAGVIFPTNDKVDGFDKNGYMIAGRTYNYEHSISKHNPTAKFYTFPVYIPKIPSPQEEHIGNVFAEWKDKFDNANTDLFKSIQNIVYHRSSINIKQ